MYIWLLLWVCVAALEALLYIFSESKALKTPFSRILLGSLLFGLVAATMVPLVMHDWHAWAASAFITPYRLVNIVRFIRRRLQRQRLRDVSLQSHVWLVSTQAVLFFVCHMLENQPVANVIGVIAAIQLVVTLGLLRSTIQTWDYAKPVAPKKHYADKELPSVSVLIPARDETVSLQQCLESIVASDYPKFEVLVLDDCSQNRRTPEIIRSFAQQGVRFIPGQPPEDNWVAKNFACEQLRQEADGTLLLYVSADVRFEPTTIRAMVEHVLSEKKEMLSVMPTRPAAASLRFSLLQPMRYYWELCLPRRMFKRPPVLSTCWMIVAERLDQYGGFASVRQSVAPETHFARRAVIADAYSFVRSNATLTVYGAKDPDTQYETTVRMRYPQLHRRLELVAITSMFELIFVAGPFLGIIASLFLPHSLAFALVWLSAAIATEIMYYYVSVETRLNSAAGAIISAPLAIFVDIYMLHVSLLRYEFGDIDWKGRNVCIPVMRVEPRKHKLQRASASSV